MILMVTPKDFSAMFQTVSFFSLPRPLLFFPWTKALNHDENPQQDEHPRADPPGSLLERNRRMPLPRATAADMTSMEVMQGRFLPARGVNPAQAVRNADSERIHTQRDGEQQHTLKNCIARSSHPFFPLYGGSAQFVHSWSGNVGRFVQFWAKRDFRPPDVIKGDNRRIYLDEENRCGRRIPRPTEGASCRTQGARQKSNRSARRALSRPARPGFGGNLYGLA